MSTLSETLLGLAAVLSLLGLSVSQQLCCGHREGCLESSVQRKEVLGLPGMSSPCHVSPNGSIPVCPKTGDDSPVQCYIHDLCSLSSFRGFSSPLWGGEETVWHGRGVG